jgi:hypothetical protein
MPTPVERQDLELAEGVPMLVVTATDGSEKHYPGDTIVISC